ncbi:unnamed protein product [Amoebophrya sp. A120]|nr:unnamed protein product [Amoebophrya sp. A120]|eukprot:GSA120T00024107001.1
MSPPCTPKTRWSGSRRRVSCSTSHARLLQLLSPPALAFFHLLTSSTRPLVLQEFGPVVINGLELLTTGHKKQKARRVTMKGGNEDSWSSGRSIKTEPGWSGPRPAARGSSEGSNKRAAYYRSALFELFAAKKQRKSLKIGKENENLEKLHHKEGAPESCGEKNPKRVRGICLKDAINDPTAFGATPASEKEKNAFIARHLTSSGTSWEDPLCVGKQTNLLGRHVGHQPDSLCVLSGWREHAPPGYVQPLKPLGEPTGDSPPQEFRFRHEDEVGDVDKSAPVDLTCKLYSWSYHWNYVRKDDDEKDENQNGWVPSGERCRGYTLKLRNEGFANTVFLRRHLYTAGWTWRFLKTDLGFRETDRDAKFQQECRSFAYNTGDPVNDDGEEAYFDEYDVDKGPKMFFSGGKWDVLEVEWRQAKTVIGQTIISDAVMSGGEVWLRSYTCSAAPAEEKILRSPSGRRPLIAAPDRNNRGRKMNIGGEGARTSSSVEQNATNSTKEGQEEKPFVFRCC